MVGHHYVVSGLVYQSVFCFFSLIERVVGMKILLTNDDGISAEGIRSLAEKFSRKHDVVISAPMYQQSGMAHALSVHRPIEIMRDKDMESKYPVEAWKIDGTPTDCVKLYLEALSDEFVPDVVVSGINHGANLATDVIYSGTVGAAMEGYLHGIASVAVSLEEEAEVSFSEVAALMEKYLEKHVKIGGEAFFHNINFPKNFYEGKAEFILSKLGKRDYQNAFHKVTENGRVFYRIGGTVWDLDDGEGTDIYTVKNGRIAVTPLNIDLTDHEALTGI